jgi:hypothetical protein
MDHALMDQGWFPRVAAGVTRYLGTSEGALASNSSRSSGEGRRVK